MQKKALELLASAAKEEAQQARAQKAEKKAAQYARKFADGLCERRCGNALGGNYEASRLVGPPLVGGT